MRMDFALLIIDVLVDFFERWQKRFKITRIVYGTPAILMNASGADI